MMATLGPMGMIFVPSVGGISHAPREFTRWEDCARGADALLHTVLALDNLGRAVRLGVGGLSRALGSSDRRSSPDCAKFPAG